MCQDTECMTPLHVSCKYGFIDLLFYLIKNCKCDPTCKDSSGKSPLQYACKHGHHEATEYLVKHTASQPFEPAADDVTPFVLAIDGDHFDIVAFLVEELVVRHSSATGKNDSALHAACEYGYLDVVRFLIEVQNCDAFYTNSDGLTPLQVACKTGYACVVSYLSSRPEYYEMEDNYATPLQLALCYGHVEIALLLINKKLDSITGARNKEWTSLHSACEYGDPQIVKFLVETIGLDPVCRDSEGFSPVHVACQNGHVEILKYFVHEIQCDIDGLTMAGQSVLHLACKYGHLNVVVYLLDISSFNSLTPYSSVPSPLEEALVSGHNDIIFFLLSVEKHLLSKKLDGYHSYLVQPVLKVFVLGNPHSGKSTLIRALLSNFSASKVSNVVNKWMNQRVSGVELNTAGIIPYHIKTNDCGNIDFYDFAGQYEHYSSSHAAVLETLRSSKHSLIFLVVDISKSVEEINHELLYWYSFLQNHYGRNFVMPEIFLIGSHGDIITKSQGQKTLSELSKKFAQFATSVILDCTKSSSSGLSRLRKQMSLYSEMHFQQFSASTQVHFFNRVLQMGFKNKVACQLSEISDLLFHGEYDALIKNNLLPLDMSSISKDLCTLNDHGQLLYLLDSENFENSWVIFKKEVLLSKINGTIFAPNSFESTYKDFGCTGIVTLSKIKRTFPLYDPQMLINFMIHLHFCQQVDKSEALMISHGKVTLSGQENSTESYYFFPALVSADRPTESCQLITTAKGYMCGWCLQCKAGTFFTSRFLHVLLLRLAFKHALPSKLLPSEHPLQPESRQCNVWKNGIHWQNRNGIETIVEVVEQNSSLILLTGCLRMKGIECIEQRSKLIKLILETKNQFSRAVEVQESFLHPEELATYPLKHINSLFTLSLSQLASSIKERKGVITSKIGSRSKMIEINELLLFEPYSCLVPEIIVELFDEAKSEDEISDNIFRNKVATYAHKSMCHFKDILILPEQESELHGELEQYADQYSSDPIHRCFLIFKTWKKFARSPTYGGLRAALDQYSVFAGRNPLV